MRLETMTWIEVEAYLKDHRGVILPTGSIEQHGPLGLIGTDMICAQEIAWAAAERCAALVAPVLSYAPAPFNMAFPGTVSLSPQLYTALATEVMTALAQHGLTRIYVLNGHGANLAPLRAAADKVDADVRLRSWWDFEPVNVLRQEWYGDWEGMHATPAETAITRHTHRVVEDPDLPPPAKLTADYIRDHAGDRHGPPNAHRADFPDGRVGSHSALGTAAHGATLLDTAAQAVAEDFTAFAG